MIRTELVAGICGVRAKLRPVMPARMIRTEVRVDPVSVNLPGAVCFATPLDLPGAVVYHILMGADGLADEQASIAFDAGASPDAAFHRRQCIAHRPEDRPGILELEHLISAVLQSPRFLIAIDH